MTTIAANIAATIDTGVASLSLGINLFIGPKRPAMSGIPQKSVFVVVTGGPPSTPILNGVEQKTVNVQIMVRSDLHTIAGSYQDGQELAEEIFSVCQYAPPAGFIDAAFVSSAPLYLGQEDNGNHLWSMNLAVTYYA